jgi:hypothetical protein
MDKVIISNREQLSVKGYAKMPPRDKKAKRPTSSAGRYPSRKTRGGTKLPPLRAGNSPQVYDKEAMRYRVNETRPFWNGLQAEKKYKEDFDRFFPLQDWRNSLSPATKAMLARGTMEEEEEVVNESHEEMQDAPQEETHEAAEEHMQGGIQQPPQETTEDDISMTTEKEMLNELEADLPIIAQENIDMDGDRSSPHISYSDDEEQTRMENILASVAAPTSEAHTPEAAFSDDSIPSPFLRKNATPTPRQEGSRLPSNPPPFTVASPAVRHHTSSGVSSSPKFAAKSPSPTILAKASPKPASPAPEVFETPKRGRGRPRKASGASPTPAKVTKTPRAKKTAVLDTPLRKSVRIAGMTPK